MNNIHRNIIPSVIAAGLLTISMLTPHSAHAQDSKKSFMVVGMQKLDTILADIDYVARLIDDNELSESLKDFVDKYAVGVDRSKPWGIGFVSQGPWKLSRFAFIPVKDLKAQLAALEEHVGKPRDAGDGIKEITFEDRYFVKQRGGWAYVAPSAEELTNLPDDPVGLLRGLTGEYDLAFRMFIQDVPEWLKKKAFQDNPEFFSDLIGDAFEQTDQATLGFAIDPKKKRAYFDFSVTDLPNAEAAEELEKPATRFSGFQVDDAALSVSFVGKLGEIDTDLIEEFGLPVVAADFFEILELDDKLETQAKRDAAKEVVKDLADVLVATANENDVDLGIVVTAKPKSLTAVFGGKVAQADKLEGVLRHLATLVKDEPEFEGVKFNVDKIDDVAIHTMTVPVPDEELSRKLLGDLLPVVVAIGSDSAFLAMGDDALKLTKQVISDSKTVGPTPVTEFQLKSSLLPILKYVESVEDSPLVATLIESLGEDDNAHLSFALESIKNGIRGRLILEEGVLKTLAELSQHLPPL